MRLPGDPEREFKFDSVGKAISLIGRVPPEQVRHYLPWGGNTPVGREILADAKKRWAFRRDA